MCRRVESQYTAVSTVMGRRSVPCWWDVGRRGRDRQGRARGQASDSISSFSTGSQRHNEPPKPDSLVRPATWSLHPAS